MSFLSFNFAIFLTLGLLVFHLGQPRWRPSVLLALSYAFYLTAGVFNALLLVVVTIGVYASALRIEKCRTERGKRALITLGVSALLVLLFFFKSATSFANTLDQQANHTGLSAIIPWAMPLGLSYYVFKMLGYLLDVYWGQLPAQRNFVSVALYGSFFPQIVSGPIQRAADFFSQLPRIEAPDAGEFVQGLRRILFGLVKKIVIADQLAAVADAVHKNPGGFSPLELLFGAYCYSFQLYTDFSGITDIAIGIGMLFGVKGPENFNLPYWSPNIQVFWRRWHMSLTSWLTDYLFLPLQMSLRQLGRLGLYMTILANMVAVGLWHGLTWTYLAFGIINGVFMIISALTLKKRDAFFDAQPGLARLRRLAGPLLTFHLIVFAQIFFRAQSLHSAFDYIAGLVPGFHHGDILAWRFNLSLLDTWRHHVEFLAVGLIIVEGINWAMRQPSWIDRFATAPRFIRWGLYYGVIIFLAHYYHEATTFLYAQF
jgi:alginate O-acetyltransferase complex protein AlgI